MTNPAFPEMPNCGRCGHSFEAHERIQGFSTQANDCAEPGCHCEGYRDTPMRKPFSGARLNEGYCLVRLTYLQAQQLFLAARAADVEGWTGRERRALTEAIDKLSETEIRFPQRMDI